MSEKTPSAPAPPWYADRDPLLEIKRKLRETREVEGMTQKELAHCAGVSSHAVISRWENARDPHWPSLRALRRLSLALGVPLTRLLPDCWLEPPRG